nr:hypothetical protein CFP56_48332 [Quercus suber]
MSTTKETEPIPHSPKRLTRTGTIPENGLRSAAFAKALPLVGVVSRRTAGTQPIDLPTFKDPQPIAKEILSLNKEAETQSEEVEEDTSGESIESLVHNEDFEVFYRPDEIEDIASSSRLTTALVNENQEITEIPEEMVLEKRMPDLLSLLESHAGTTTPKVPIVLKPPTLIPPPLQTELIDKKRKKDKKGGKGSTKKALNAAGVNLSSELRNLEKVFYPLAIRAQTFAQSSPNTTATTQPSPVENPPLKSSTSALPTSTVVAKTSSLEKDLTLAKVAPLASQPH